MSALYSKPPYWSGILKGDLVLWLKASTKQDFTHPKQIFLLENEKKMSPFLFVDVFELFLIRFLILKLAKPEDLGLILEPL